MDTGVPVVSAVLLVLGCLATATARPAPQNPATNTTPSPATSASVSFYSSQNICAKSAVNGQIEDSMVTVTDFIVYDKPVSLIIRGCPSNAKNVSLWINNMEDPKIKQLVNTTIEPNLIPPNDIIKDITLSKAPPFTGPYMFTALYIVDKTTEVSIPWASKIPVDFMVESDKINCLEANGDQAKQGMIAGISIGSLFLIIAVVFAFVFFRTRKIRRREEKGKMIKEVKEKKDGQWEDEYYEDDSESETQSSMWTIFLNLIRKPKPTSSSSQSSDSDEADPEKQVTDPLNPPESQPASAAPSKKKPKSIANPRPRKQWNFYDVNDTNNTNNNVKSYPHPSNPLKRITVISGPPPRFTGGPSTWNPNAEKGRRYKAMVSHTPGTDDELSLERNDLCIIEEVYEDGWVRVWKQGNMNDIQKVTPNGIIPSSSTSTSAPKTDENEENSNIKRSGVVPFHYLVLAREDEVPFNERKTAAVGKLIAMSALQTH